MHPNSQRRKDIVNHLQRYEIWLEEAALNLIMEEEMPIWNQSVEEGEEIEIDDSFFTATSNERTKTIWSLVIATRHAINQFKAS